MNQRLDDLMYEAGLTAQGCWDQMDDYDRAAVTKFAQLIVRECAEKFAAEPDRPFYGRHVSYHIKKHFGVEE